MPSSFRLPQVLGGEQRRALHNDFREHFGFLALMLVSGACVVYLMGVLRSILRPFLWALFLVMGLAPAVSRVERLLLCLATQTCRCASGAARASCLALQWASGGRSNLRSRSSGSRRSAGASPSVIGSIVADERRLPNGTAGGDGASGDRDFEAEDSDSSRPERAWSRCGRFIVRTVAIGLVVAAVLCAIGGFVLMVIQSVVSLQDHWPVYKQGARNVLDAVQRYVVRISGSMPRGMADELVSNLLSRAEELLSALLTEVLSNAWRFVLEFLMMGLYLAFWLSDPMPVGTKMEELFKRYILLKGLACLGYGVCVGVLLYALGVDLAAAFGLAAFLLSFVPEVGAIVALLLPAPVILFDSRLESPAVTLLIASLAQLGLKFVFGNVVEVKLVESDHLMKMHPVIILLAVTFFGFIWGPTGMLLSVPLVAYLKVALLSDRVPPCYRDPLLVLLEGDRSAPAKYACQRRETLGRAGGGSDVHVAALSSAVLQSGLGDL